jgi:hypothetical protein
MTKKKSNKKNKEIDALEAIDTFTADFGMDIDGIESEEDKKLVHYLAFGLRPRQAALRAGKPGWFANSKVYQLVNKNKAFQAKIEGVRSNIRERYLDFATDCLPEVALVEKKVLSSLAADPGSINPTTAKVMRDLKKSAGVLQDETVRPVQVQINLALLQRGQEDQLLSEITLEHPTIDMVEDKKE